jgi:hypothetical protein
MHGAFAEIRLGDAAPTAVKNLLWNVHLPRLTPWAIGCRPCRGWRESYFGWPSQCCRAGLNYAARAGALRTRSQGRGVAWTSGFEVRGLSCRKQPGRDPSPHKARLRMTRRVPGLAGISFWLAIPALPRWAKLCRPCRGSTNPFPRARGRFSLEFQIKKGFSLWKVKESFLFGIRRRPPLWKSRVRGGRRPWSRRKAVGA